MVRPNSQLHVPLTRSLYCPQVAATMLTNGMFSSGLLPSLFLLLGCAISLVTARYALTRTTIAGHRYFALFMVAIAIWMFGYALEFMTVTPTYKFFWAKVQYLGIPFVTPLLVIYLVRYRGSSWLDGWRVVPVMTVPVATATIIWVKTEWIWESAEIITVNNLTFYTFSYGPWFIVNFAFAYLCHFIGLLVLFDITRRSPTLTRLQGACLFGGLSLPLLGNVFYIFDIDLLPGIDWTPFAIVLFGIVTAWVIFEFRWLDLTPIASSTALESLPDSVLLLDNKNRIRAFNNNARLFYNIEVERPSQLNIKTLLLPTWWQAIRDVPITSRCTLELPDNEEYQHYEVRLTPVYDRRDRLRGRLLLARDITTRKTAQLALAQREAELAIRVDERTSELRAANKALTNAAKLKDQFLASMSHELRTPLNAVIGTAEAIREEVYGGVTEQQKVALDRVEQSAHHLLSLINDILDVSKIQSGEFRIHVAPTSVQDIGEAALNVVRSAASRKQIELSTSYDITHPIIHVDERRICQIMINLLANAIKFTAEGGKVSLDVYDSLTTRITYFLVSDTGIGIAPVDLERLFKPFVQLDASLARRYEGTGLGLTLAQRLAEMHGGSITVRSEVGVGSTFTVALPWDTPVNESAVAEEDLRELFAYPSVG